MNKLEEEKEKVNVFFSVDSLDYLQKGGRISGTKAAIGTLLNIKPILKIEDGLVKQKTQVRGSKKIIPSLI
ncbi:DegV family protein, partial [Burkholderia pseudomallei]